jgi:hypothetical protein
MAASALPELHVGMRVFDAHGAFLGAVTRTLTRDHVLRLGRVRAEDLPPESDFPYLEVECRTHGPTLLYCGYHIPRHAVVRVDGSDLHLSGIRADLDILGWNHTPAFLH